MNVRAIVLSVLFLLISWTIYTNFFHNKRVTFGETSQYGYNSGGELVEHFEHKQEVRASENLGQNEVPQEVHMENRTPSSCFPQKVLTAEELLPRDDSAAISDFNQEYPIGEGVSRGINYLSSGYQIGVNTVGQSLRNANRQLRAEPPNPQVNVSPWLNTTIGPDLDRRPLNDDSCHK